MAIKYFWIYLGVFFAGAITLFATANRIANRFAGSGMKPILYGILAAVVFGGLAFLSTLTAFNNYIIFWILALIFLGFGLFHILVFHKKYFFAPPQNRGTVVLGEILYSLALIFFSLVAFSALIFFVMDNRSFPFYPMLTSMLAFFVPVSLYYTFEAATRIPDPVFASWIYPINEQIDLPDERPDEKLLVIAFAIAKKAAAPENKTNFRAKAPETMKLGDLYYHFINDYNELHSETIIEFADTHDSHEWWFRIKPKWYQANRILDPDLTIRENKIKENTVIICERFQIT